MAKIILTYPAEGVFNNADHLETYLDAGDASDRVDWLIENENIYPLMQIEYHDGKEFLLLPIEMEYHGNVCVVIADKNVGTEKEYISPLKLAEKRLKGVLPHPLSPKGFGSARREALINLLDCCNEIEKKYALSIANHKRWYNDRRKSYYVIVGVVRSCEAPTWELLYKREEDAESNEYFRRPAWEWQQLNRDGNPRFVKA
jgi:hypothetical protein